MVVCGYPRIKKNASAIIGRNIFLLTPSAGIEPTSQEPESYVLSVAPRGQNTSDLNII
jgi:hypothetical protein